MRRAIAADQDGNLRDRTTLICFPFRVTAIALPLTAGLAQSRLGVRAAELVAPIISHPVYRLFGLSGGYAVAMSGSLVVLGEWLSGAGRDDLWLFAGYFMATRQTEGLS